MSEEFPEMKPGKVGFWAGKDGQLHGAIVTKFEAYRTLWETKYYPSSKTCKIWERKEYSDRIDPGEVIHSFSCDNPQKAAAIAASWFEKYKEKLNRKRAALEKKAKPLVVTQEIERAWMEANKTSWPNLHRAIIEGTDIQTALKVDLSVMGFAENVLLTEAVAKAFNRTKLSDPDRLDLWIVSNWSHGKKLQSLSPLNRLKLAREAGFSATEKMLAMRLSRKLNLTPRSKRQ